MDPASPRRSPAVTAADERRHRAGEEPSWCENITFDFFTADASIAGWVGLALHPNHGVAWYHALVVGAGRPTVAVADCAVPLPPRAGGWEIRTEGLWADHTCESAVDHWSLGNEAFAIAVDDPADLYDPEPRGERTPLGLDLEFEADGDAHRDVTAASRYDVPCRVHGEILVGDDQIELDGWGQRTHEWGARDWWAYAWLRTAGRMDDGERFAASDLRNPARRTGSAWRQGGDAGYRSVGDPDDHEAVASTEQLGRHGLPTSGRMTAAAIDLDLALAPLHMAPALLVAPDGRQSRLPRALCRVTDGSGARGMAWTEWNQPG